MIRIAKYFVFTVLSLFTMEICMGIFPTLLLYFLTPHCTLAEAATFWHTILAFIVATIGCPLLASCLCFAIWNWFNK